MVLAGVALAGVAVAEESSWSSVMSLVRDATTYAAPERSRRQMAPEEGYGTNTSKVTAEPLQGYLDNPEYFSVDYCSRYSCKCTMPYTTETTRAAGRLLEKSNLTWTTLKEVGQNQSGDGSRACSKEDPCPRAWNNVLGPDSGGNAAQEQCTPGCVCQLNEAGKFEQICMWDERMCDCQSQEFFEQVNSFGQTGVDFLYPAASVRPSQLPNQTMALGAADNKTQNNGRAVAAMKAMRANRHSNTANVCIACQSGMVLSGGQCYAGGTVPVAINMGIVVGLFTVPSIIGFWYVLHQIVDPTDTGMEIGDVKKSA